MARRNNSKINTVISPSGQIRFEQPKSSRQKKSRLAGIEASDVNPVQGFTEFLREYTVVSVAVAFVIGLQAQVLVKQIVTSFIDPLFKLLFGQALSIRTFTLQFRERTAVFDWGAFAYSLLNFLFVLAAIYGLVKFLSLDKFDKPKKKS